MTTSTATNGRPAMSDPIAVAMPDPNAFSSGRDGNFDGSLPRSYLRPALHIALLDGSSHGYELLEYVHRFGLASVDLGGIYRTLRVMEHDRVVESEWEASEAGPPRRVYELTESGIDASEAYLRALRVARAHLDHMLSSVPLSESLG